MSRIYLPKPTLLIVTGVPGSGKSSLLRGLHDPDGRKIADGLVERCHIFYLRVDSIKEPFTTLRRGDYYEEYVRPASYSVADNILRENLFFGNSVAMDSTFSTKVKDISWIADYESTTLQNEAKLKLIRCVAPDEVIRGRITERVRIGDKREEWKVDNWQQHRTEEPIHVPIPTFGIEVDTSGDPNRNLESVLEYLTR